MNEVNEIKICTQFSDIVINLNNVVTLQFLRNDNFFVISYLSSKLETFALSSGNETDDGSLYDLYDYLVDKAEFKRVISRLFDINLHL
jgi:hypothetical protein